MMSRLMVVLGFALFMNAGLVALQIRMLSRRKPWPRWIGIMLIAWAMFMTGLFLLQAFAPSDWSPFIQRWLYMPMAVEMSWNVFLLILLFFGTILFVLSFHRILQTREKKPLSPGGISRRKFLYMAGYGAAPALAIGMGVHGSNTRYDLRVRPFSIPLAGLPPELEGFTIAHVSDLHSGIFVGPERLKIIRDATNDLKADLITVTGDIINREMTEFGPAIQTIKAMESRHGTYMCEGNHDLIPGPGVVIDACAENNLPMLAHESVILPIHGRRLILGGLPWIKEMEDWHPELVDRLFPARKEGDVRILLAHHPEMLDIAKSADLVLSGHTHGGQIMFGDHFGLGPTFFKYWSGFYRHDNTSMVVSNGCGDWFPCRICAPAEITLLTLKAS